MLIYFKVKLNPGVNIQVVQNGVTLRHPSIPLPKVPMPYPPPNPTTPESIIPQSTLQPYGTPSYGTNFFGKRFPTLVSLSTTEPPSNDYSYLDGQYHNLYKRDKILTRRQSNDEDNDSSSSIDAFESKKKIVKRETTVANDDKVDFQVSDVKEKTLVKRDSDKIKRGLLQLSDGSVIDDTYLVSQNLNNDYFTGLASFGVELPKYKNKSEEREPAEAEVKMVMDVCDGCTPDPFEKALIMDWRRVPKKIYSGALWTPATPSCKAF